jgi:hypothetical protein
MADLHGDAISRFRSNGDATSSAAPKNRAATSGRPASSANSAMPSIASWFRA